MKEVTIASEKHSIIVSDIRCAELLPSWIDRFGVLDITIEDTESYPAFATLAFTDDDPEFPAYMDHLTHMKGECRSCP
jgi:hypothetical protein